MMKSTADSVSTERWNQGFPHRRCRCRRDERGDRQYFEVIGGAGVRQTLIHLDFRVAEQVGHGQCVAHTLLDEHVAVGAGDADQLDFRASQSIRNGKRVINAGIKIKNHLFHVCAFPL